MTDAVRAVLASLREEIAEGRLDANGIDLAVSGIEEAVARRVRQDPELFAATGHQRHGSHSAHKFGARANFA